MVRKILLALAIILILFCSMTNVIAYEPTIKLKTAPGYDIAVNVLENVEEESIKKFVVNSTSAIEHSFSFSTDFVKVDIVVVLKQNNKIKKLQRFEEESTKSNINLAVYPDEYDAPEPEEEEEIIIGEEDEEIITEELSDEELEGSSITGGVIGLGKDIFSSKITYFIIIGLVIATVVIFMIKKYSDPFQRYNKIPKSQVDKERGIIKKEDFAEVKDSEISSAEKKLKEAQEEIESIKNRKKEVTDAEQAFEQAKKNLEKIQRKDTDSD